ncbi:MAG: hypothetical protein F4057_12485 [Acidobacteria bacterium]|nr:hypothetical protein [Acidobacteriota bacterium]
MKNKLTDLNDHLFSAIERLNQEGMKPEKIQTEVTRGKAIAQLSEQVLKSGALALEAEKFRAEIGYGRTSPKAHLPALLENGNGSDAD